MIRLARLDHFVLTVTSVEEAARFYARVLGFDVDRTKEGRVSLRSGDLRINLHDEDHAPPRRAALPHPGAADFCYEVEGPMEAVIDHLCDCGVALEQGPVTRNGSKGEMISVYFRDPDRNLVELSVYR
ncbi:MAG: VOC family protein [Alphaproteobacteria bacterium]|nr:VOC family protein [Pseudomonadota bacterium]TDI65509.1 MAG: VOC family protein [Alphaproteobacteria bacterium]